MLRVEAMFKEYETLRQESLDSMNSRNQIVSFGLATIGLLGAAVLSADDKIRSTRLILTVFGLGIPVLSVLVLYIWLGEVERMMRVGVYLEGLEERINAQFEADEPPLGWEAFLRLGRAQMVYPYVVVIGAFLGFALFGPVLAVMAGSVSFWDYRWLWSLNLAALVLVGCDVWERARRFK